MNETSSFSGCAAVLIAVTAGIIVLFVYPGVSMVPDVTGKTDSDGKNILVSAGFNVTVNVVAGGTKGRVHFQSPVGILRWRGSPVSIDVEEGPLPMALPAKPAAELRPARGNAGIVIRAGTTFPVRLSESLTVDESTLVKAFNAAVASDVLAGNDRILCYKGSGASGEVRTSKLGATTKLEARLKEITLVNGTRLYVQTEQLSKVASFDSGRVLGKAMGCGAVGGALAAGIGMLFGIPPQLGGMAGGALGGLICGAAAAKDEQDRTNRQLIVESGSTLEFKLREDAVIYFENVEVP